MTHRPLRRSASRRGGAAACSLLLGGCAALVPTAPRVDPATAEAIEVLMGERLTRGVIDEASFAAIEQLGASGDPRVAWWLADLQRIATASSLSEALTLAQQELLGFEIDPFRKYCLMNGLDDIGLTLRHADEIRAFEERHLAAQPWLANVI